MMTNAINKSFLGHGIFVELNPLVTLQRYASYGTRLPPNPSKAKLVDKFIEALSYMNISSVWIEVFSSYGEIDPTGTKGTRELVDGLKAAGIGIVPWGYCFGKNSENTDKNKNDLHRAKTLCKDKYKLDVFVADIEPWNISSHGEDKWNKDALHSLMTGLSDEFGKANLGISSFANLDKQPKALEYLKPVIPLASFCAPQIYWNLRQPVKWAIDSLSSWRKADPATELVATVQSYWGKDDKAPSREVMEKKVKIFVDTFADAEWKKIIGLNWYHGGNKNTANSGAMSQNMIDTIAAAKLHLKPYRKP